MSQIDSAEAAAPRRKHRKHKDKSEKKKSKKRKRDEVEDNDTPPTKSSRRDRCENRQTDQDTELRVDKSPFFMQTVALRLPLSPITQTEPLNGLCAEHLSPLLLTYYEPLKAVVLAYSDIHLSDNPSKQTSDREQVCAESVDEYSVNYAWVTANFLLLRPGRGTQIEGQVRIQNESYIGLICWNMFNANIPRKRIPKDWRWRINSERPKKKQKTSAVEPVTQEDSQGYYVDGNGDKVDASLIFRVSDFETVSTSTGAHGYLGIEGTLLSEEEEKESEKQELQKQRELREEREDRQNDQQHSKSVDKRRASLQLSGDDY
ncbi:MAG: hypothetical protein M1831_001755 [Alyxoria varia]|nr:MAG: hypothetical protein M1831_001755 [Alyxoria varia]